MDINRIGFQQPPHLSALFIGKPLGIDIPLSCNLTEVAVITKFQFGIKVVLGIFIGSYRITLNNPTLIGIDRKPIPSAHRVKVIDYIRALAILNILIFLFPYIGTDHLILRRFVLGRELDII